MRDWNAIVRDRLIALGMKEGHVADVPDVANMVDELAQHVAQAYAEHRAAGLDDAAAAARALAVVEDGPRLVAEAARSVRADGNARGWHPARWWADAVRDVRYAIRLLRASPAFTAVAVLTIALGIGGTASIFTVVNAVVLKPLPFAAPDQLVMVGEQGSADEPNNVGYATFADWRTRSQSYAGMALIRLFAPAVVIDGNTERVSGMRVSANFFRLLGASPALGRDFDVADDQPGHANILMLSDTFWRRGFKADPHVVGRTVSVAGAPFTVVGVMASSYEPLISERFYQRADVWAPLGYDTTLPQACRGCQHLKALARLKSGVTIEAARGELTSIQAQLTREHPTEYPRSGAMAVVPMRTVLLGSQSAVLTLLFSAVTCVLLIATLNMANLLIGRLSTRRRELALRVALGAGRARVIRQMAIESLVLATIGGAIGVGMAMLGVPLLVRLSPTSSSRLAGAGVDLRVVAFAAATSVVTALAFGLLPALRGSKAAVSPTLREGDARATGRGALRRGLVVVELVVAVVLAVGAGLMIRSVNRLTAVDPGFDPAGVLTMSVSLVGPSYANAAKLVDTIDHAVASVKAVPGVRFAAMSGQVPLGGNYDAWGFHIQGRGGNPADDASVQRYSVTSEYFDVLRIPLRRGRYLTATDTTNSEPVLVIGEYTARKLFPGVDPIGQRVRIGDPNSGDWRTIVGIVGDVRHVGLSEPPSYTMYVPESQVTDAFLTLALRSDRRPEDLVAETRQRLREAAPGAPIYAIVSLSDLATKSVGPRRFVMTLLVVFAGVALVLTAVGVYGVVSFAVAARRREIGIRTALGATSREIVTLVAVEDGAMIATGLVVGTVAALGATRLLMAASLPGLFGVSAADPLTFVGAVGFLALAAMVAESIPIARALKVDPTVALRQ
jgi:putative ABC transport system permease protein